MVAGISWLSMTALVEARTVTGELLVVELGGEGLGVG